MKFGPVCHEAALLTHSGIWILSFPARVVTLPLSIRIVSVTWHITQATLADPSVVAPYYSDRTYSSLNLWPAFSPRA